MLPGNQGRARANFPWDSEHDPQVSAMGDTHRVGELRALGSQPVDTTPGELGPRGNSEQDGQAKTD